MVKMMNTLSNVNQTTQLDTTLVKQHYYPYLVITLSALFLFYKYVLQVSPSIMTVELMQHFQIDGAGLGNLAATFFYTYLITQLFVGPLLDKYSPRLLTTLAIAISACGAMLFAHAQTLMDAQLARGLIGIGAAFATVSYMKMVALWFKPQQFAVVGGLLATAAMVGSMAGEAPLSLLMSHVGWRSSLDYCGVLGLVLAFIFFAFVRNKTDCDTQTVKNSVTFSDFKKLLKKKSSWYLTFYSGLAFSPLAVFGGLWGNPFLQIAHHLTKTEAASLTSVMFLGLAVGGPVFGYLADRVASRSVLMLSGLLLSLLALTTAIYLNFLSVIAVGVLLFLFGFGTGAFMLGFAVGKDMNIPALAATVVALINTGDAIFGAFSEPLVGKLLDLFWNGKVALSVHLFNLHDYYTALAILPLYLLAAVGFLFLLKTCSDLR